MPDFFRTNTSNNIRCRHTSGRDYFTPWGNCGYLFVWTGNLLSSRTVLLAVIASWCGLRWLIEQPDGSYLPELPRLQWLFGSCKALVKDFLIKFHEHSRTVFYMSEWFCFCSSMKTVFFMVVLFCSSMQTVHQ